MSEKRRTCVKRKCLGRATLEWRSFEAEDQMASDAVESGVARGSVEDSQAKKKRAVTPKGSAETQDNVSCHDMEFHGNENLE